MMRILCAGLLLLTTACASWDGHFDILGYTTRPNYDPNIRTVHVPIFQNTTFYRGMEFDLTEAIQREIPLKSPYRITSDPNNADTELVGTITNFTKNLVLISPSNGTRVQENVLTVKLTWRDRRTGEVLSRRQRRPGEPIPLDLPPPGQVNLPGVNLPATPTAPSPLVQDALNPIEPRPATPPLPAPPIVITTSVTFQPELGQSSDSARIAAINKMAIQIVNMMQTPW